MQRGIGQFANGGTLSNLFCRFFWQILYNNTQREERVENFIQCANRCDRNGKKNYYFFEKRCKMGQKKRGLRIILEDDKKNTIVLLYKGKSENEAR
mmetsp:Transcript_9067/g.33440  ORF Transcript_9067/g.33440 Transcript_9067/m.33440 type:complete len:96 (-) Transcript_9067:54-341(-)